MQGHSIVSIISFPLTFFCYPTVILPMLLLWLPELQRRRTSGHQEARPRGGTEAPYCPACKAEKDEPAEAKRKPPPRITPRRGRLHEVDTHNHYCPNKDCPYFGWVDRGNIRSDGHPNGGHWRQLQYVVCHRYFMETTGTIFFGKSTPPETIWRALKTLAEGLGRNRLNLIYPTSCNDWQARFSLPAAGGSAV